MRINILDDSMCLKIQYLLLHCLAAYIVLCLHGRGYQIVSVQTSIGNDRRVDESNTQDKHGPNCSCSSIVLINKYNKSLLSTKQSRGVNLFHGM